jgi:hypothetical protein
VAKAGGAKSLAKRDLCYLNGMSSPRAFVAILDPVGIPGAKKKPLGSGFSG